MPSTKNTAADAATTDAFKRRFMRRLIAVLVGGMLLDGYILGAIGPVSATMGEDLGLSTLWIGLVASGALFGTLIGSPIGGWAGDKFGRKPLFMVDMAIFVVASAMQFFIDSAWQAFLVRLLMGIAIGCEYSVGWPLLAEFSPARLRGRLMAATNVAWYGGFMVGFATSYFLHAYTDLGWRTILGSSTVLALILAIARLGLPESPRWLWNVGRKDEALAIARKYMTDHADMVDVENEDTKKGTVGMLFSREHWRATVFASVFFVCVVTPYFALATFADDVLKQYGLSGGLAGGVGLSLVATIGVVITMLLIDKAGRRVFTIPTQWICTVVLALIGLWAGAPPMVVLILFLVFSFLNAMAGTLTSIYPAEVFPTEIRGVGTGFAASMSRVGAGSATFLLPWSVENLGNSVTMLIAAGISLIGAAVSQVLAPETKGRSLTETAAMIKH